MGISQKPCRTSPRVLIVNANMHHVGWNPWRLFGICFPNDAKHVTECGVALCQSEIHAPSSMFRVPFSNVYDAPFSILNAKISAYSKIFPSCEAFAIHRARPEDTCARCLELTMMAKLK